MERGFPDNGIRMNPWIAQKDQWTQEELQERSDYLVGQIAKIWTAPESSFKPAQKQTAQFHGNWIKRFHDVIIPYITGMQLFNRLCMEASCQQISQEEAKKMMDTQTEP